MANDKEKFEKFLRKYNLEELTNRSDLESIRKIYYENLGTGLLETGMTFSSFAKAGKEEERLAVYYLHTIMEQNFIMIRQLERISKAVGGEPEPKKPTKMEEYLKAKQESVRNK